MIGRLWKLPDGQGPPGGPVPEKPGGGGPPVGKGIGPDLGEVFARAGTMVPGDVIESDLWVRNASQDRARVDV